jgi:hypothetical protein
MVRNRYDETWHRVREWTNEQAPSERLASECRLGAGVIAPDCAWEYRA